MAVSVDVVAQKCLNPVAGTPIDINFPCEDKTTVKILIGLAGDEAVQDTDYTVTLNTSTYEDFVITPLSPLIDKIDALLLADPEEVDQIVVRRELNYLSDFTEALAFFRAKIASEFNKTIFRFQQLHEELSRCFKLSEVDLGSSAAFPALDSLKGKYIAVNEEGVIIGADGTTSVPISDAMLPVVGAASLSAARTNLGLGTMATETASNFLTTASAASTYLTQSNAASTYRTAAQVSSAIAAHPGVSKAWCNFNNGTSPISPTKAHNVTSVTKSATGTFQLNLTENTTDGNGAVVANLVLGNPSGFTNYFDIEIGAVSSSSVMLYVRQNQGTLADPSSPVHVALFD